jgi:hypothetical protein
MIFCYKMENVLCNKKTCQSAIFVFILRASEWCQVHFDTLKHGETLTMLSM